MQFFGTWKAYLLMCLMIMLLQPFWMLVSRETAPGRHRAACPETTGSIRKKAIAEAVFCLLTACAVAALFQLYPGNSLLTDVDPSVFLYIGKRMTAGSLPYRDLFDHKGPLLYLIQYAGALLSDEGRGVWFLEVLNLAVTFWIQLRICRLVTDRPSAGWLSILLVFGMCGWNVYQGGNFAEEYALPWISLGMYVFLRFFKTGEVRLGQIVLLGLSFGAVFLLRVNMTAIWPALVPVVLIVLLKNKRADRILPCLAAFLAGCAAIVLPVVLWAAAEGFLQDLWECYFLFNFRYTEEVTLGAREYAGLTLEMLRMVWPGVLAFAAALLCCVPKRTGKAEADENRAMRLTCRRLVNAALVAFLVSLLCAQMSGRAYAHYAMILLPVLTVPVSVCLEETGRLWAGCLPAGGRGELPAAPVLSAVVILAGALWYAGKVPPDEAEKHPMVQYVLSHTQSEDDVLVLGNSCWLYLTADRHTENRFFYQTPPVAVSEELKNEFMKSLREKRPDMVLAPGYDLSDAEGWLTEVYEILCENGLSYHYDDGFGVFEEAFPGE